MPVSLRCHLTAERIRFREFLLVNRGEAGGEILRGFSGLGDQWLAEIEAHVDGETGRRHSGQPFWAKRESLRMKIG